MQWFEIRIENIFIEMSHSKSRSYSYIVITLQPSKSRCKVRQQLKAEAISEFFSLPRQYVGKKSAKD